MKSISWKQLGWKSPYDILDPYHKNIMNEEYIIMVNGLWLNIILPTRILIKEIV